MRKKKIREELSSEDAEQHQYWTELAELVGDAEVTRLVDDRWRFSFNTTGFEQQAEWRERDAPGLGDMLISLLFEHKEMRGLLRRKRKQPRRAAQTPRGGREDTRQQAVRDLYARNDKLTAEQLGQKAHCDLSTVYKALPGVFGKGR